MEEALNKSNILDIDCSARNVIECAFGRLKACFSALRMDTDINLDDLPTVIYSCFVLHNFLRNERGIHI